MRKSRLGVIFLVLIGLLVAGRLIYERECAKEGVDCPKEEPIDYEKDGLPEIGYET